MSVKNTARSYGGEIRSRKGKLQEIITESLVKIAWEELGQKSDRLGVNKKKIKQNIFIIYLLISMYIIDEKFIIGIECKAYTENVMKKNINRF